MPTCLPTQKRKAGRGCTYVLWGDGFDEVLTVAVVAELRKIGWQVKLVGRRRQPMVGAYDVTLVPEVGLDEVLAEQERLSCLAVPYDDIGWQRLQQEQCLCQLLIQCMSSPIPLLLRQYEVISLIKRKVFCV